MSFVATGIPVEFNGTDTTGGDPGMQLPCPNFLTCGAKLRQVHWVLMAITCCHRRAVDLASTKPPNLQRAIFLDPKPMNPFG